MLDWVREYQPLLTLVVSTCTLLVWLFYAHLRWPTSSASGDPT